MHGFPLLYSKINRSKPQNEHLSRDARTFRYTIYAQQVVTGI